MIFWKEFLILKERASLLPIIFALSGRMIEHQRGTRTSPVESLCLAIDFLIDNIYVRFGSSVFRQVIGIPMGTNSAPLLADLFLHTFEYDFKVKTMKQDITKAIQFSNTFRYIDDLFSANNVDFGNYISAIHPSELELRDTSTSSTEVRYLDTNIKTGDNTPFRVSIYDKRDDFSFRIVNFPHMDSNIPAIPA